VFPLPEAHGIRVFVIDSTRTSSQAISAALDQNGFAIAYAGSDANEAIKEADRRCPDVALISAELRNEKLTAYDLAEKMHNTHGKLNVIMMLEEPEPALIVKAFRSGARGVFSRNSTLELLSKCILAVHRGQIWASNSDLEYLINALRLPLRLVSTKGIDLITRRERDVVQWVSEGLTNREIAGKLGLSENTVKNYLFRIFDKLGVSSRVELILYAVSQLVQQPMLGDMQVPSHTFNDDAGMFRWCREAAGRFVVTQHRLGELYRDGRGVVADPQTAYMWFYIAEKLSRGIETEIHQARLELRGRLERQQIIQATTRAEEWLRKRQELSSEQKTA
jgi:two-component system nitrate/nitrite response regulator NarL